MANTRNFILAALVLLLAIASVTAGDFAKLNFIGFSKDGKYLAFEEHGVHDGSGFPYSSIYFVDVAKNSYAAPPVNVSIENEATTESQARTRARTRAAATLRRLRIVDRNTGTLLVSRQLTDVSVHNYVTDEPDKTQTINFATIFISMYREGDYDLVLKPIEVKSKDCEYADRPIYKFELTLKDKTENKTVVLQKDMNLPRSRSCPIDYSMQHIYVYENNIAVFINTFHIGFEGPDMRYVVVTGRYK